MIFTSPAILGRVIREMAEDIAHEDVQYLVNLYCEVMDLETYEDKVDMMYRAALEQERFHMQQMVAWLYPLAFDMMYFDLTDGVMANKAIFVKTGNKIKITTPTFMEQKAPNINQGDEDYADDQ